LDWTVCPIGLVERGGQSRKSDQHLTLNGNLRMLA
jgi:hypothetical protein